MARPLATPMSFLLYIPVVKLLVFLVLGVIGCYRLKFQNFMVELLLPPTKLWLEFYTTADCYF